jgi:hypothetical protein
MSPAYAATYKLTIGTVDTTSTTIKGTATAKKTIKTTINKKTYTTTSDSKGNYSIKIPKQTAGQNVTVKLYVSGKVVKTSSKIVTLPLGGNEPKYAPKDWNSINRALESVNCYAYAVLKVCSTKYGYKIQPGELSGQRFTKLTEADIIAATKRDLNNSQIGKTIYSTTANAKPPKGFRKVALVIAPNEDYHWYEQDSQGYWSHKPGFSLVTNTDASKKVIYDPKVANRKYTYTVKTKNNNNNKYYYTLNYSTFCNYYMIGK